MRGLGLKSAREWREYCKSGKKPADIPAEPIDIMRSWLVRLGRLARDGQDCCILRQYRPFKEARAFVRRLGLKSEDRMARIL